MRISLLALLNILRREADDPLIIQNCPNKKLFWIKQFDGDTIANALTYDTERQTAFAISGCWERMLKGIVADIKQRNSAIEGIDDLTEEDWKSIYTEDKDEQRTFEQLAHEHDSGIPSRTSLL